jgi:membrane-associated phospholipid phosphatase
MAPLTIQPTRADIAIASKIVDHTGPNIERIAQAFTWGADEHVLCTLAAGWWLYSNMAVPAQRRASGHVLLTTVVASALPHLLKKVFDQKRPDRLTVRGHQRGVPFSGKELDVFPSGHAVHIGALASAASQLPSTQRNAAWSTGAVLVITRIVLLAHWTSDVVVGLAVGAAIERALRRFTDFGHRGADPAQERSR